jgi:hypothetical protein
MKAVGNMQIISAVHGSNVLHSLCDITSAWRDKKYGFMRAAAVSDQI